MDYFLAPVADVAQALYSSSAGLDAATAAQRLRTYGPNLLADTKNKTAWQLLLQTDGLPGLALAYEPSEVGSMQRPPTDPRQTIFANGLGWFIVLVGALVGGLTIGIEAWALRRGIVHWQTTAFTVLCFSQLGLALAIRSRQESIFTQGLLSNKPMLGAVGLTGRLLPADCIRALLQRRIPYAAADVGRAGHHRGRIEPGILGCGAAEAPRPAVGVTAAGAASGTYSWGRAAYRGGLAPLHGLASPTNGRAGAASCRRH